MSICSRLSGGSSLPPSYVGGPNTGGQNGPGITGPLMAQYLLAMLGARPGHGDPLHDILGGVPGGPDGSGRWGDYVFNQEGNPVLSSIWLILF